MAVAAVAVVAMTAIDDTLWQSIAGLRPALREGLQTQTQAFRGEDWVVLHDPISGDYYRCTARVFHWLQQLDGTRSIAEALAREPESQRPGREEVLRLITALDEKHLWQQPLDHNLERAVQRHALQYKKQQRQRWSSLLALRFALWNPQPFLDRHAQLWPKVINAGTLWFGLLAGAIALWLAVQQSDALAQHWQSRFIDASNVVWLWLLYPPVKLMHELGHAIALRRWGGRVQELGMMLLVFMPVPYVDATTAYSLPSKRQRMMVAAAGIIVELLLAALALMAWSLAEPGLWRDLCFNVLVIAGISTLLINGNPLLKFDGYHVLTEYLEMPNLASRSQRVVRAQWSRWLLGFVPSDTLVEAPDQLRICRLYGVAAALYRLLIAAGIVWLVSGYAFLIGVALAAWYVVQQWLWPAAKGMLYLWRQARQQGGITALLGRCGGGALLLLVVLCWPWQSATVFEAVLSLPEDAAIRAGAAGLVSEHYVPSG
ncbi:MAG: hypothetical protein R3183_06535, partial [Oleiphilaceae bacterium]|nr:hypothetical protein [Oleiphilaceae bacterium]